MLHSTTEHTGLDIKNQISLTGKILGLPKYRKSPAGLQSAHFKLWHQSSQEQGYGKLELQRKVEFSISVSVANNILIEKLQKFTENKLLVNKVWVNIKGYIASRTYSTGEQQLVLFAQHIELLNKGDNYE